MPRKPTPTSKRKATAKPPAKRKPNDPAQYKRFLEAAKAVEADEKPQAFDKAFKRVTKR